MAGTLSPETTYQIAPEAPVQRTSPVEGLASLFGQAVEVIGAERSQGANLEAMLARDLQEAQAYRDEGRESEARQMERRILTNYAVAGGDVASEDTAELIRQVTGRPMETLGFSSGELALQRLADPSTPEGQRYTQAYASTFATNPDMTDQERHTVAMGLYAQEQANDMVLQEAQFNWNRVGEQAFLAKTDTFMGTLIGGVAIMAQQGESLSLEDIQSIRSEFNVFQTTLRRPSNITDAQWEPIATRLSNMAATLDYWEKLAGPDNLSAVATSNLMRQVELLNIGDPKKDILMKLIANDDQLFAEYGALQGEELFGILRSMIETEGTPSALDLRDPNTWDESILTDEDRTPKGAFQLFTDGRNALEVANAGGRRIVDNKEARDAWTQAVTRGLTATLAVHESGEFLKASDYATMFDKRYMENLRNLQMVDPALYNVVLEKTNRVLNEAAIQLSTRQAQIGADFPLQVNAQGEFRLDRVRLAEVLGENELANLTSAIDRRYGGDWDAAFADGGRLLTTGDIGVTWERIGGRRGQSVPRQLRQVNNSLREIVRIQNDMGILSPAEVQTIDHSNSFTLQMMDKLEGGGDYNTLWAHSQKPGQAFAGVKPTQMTIADVLAFQDLDGAYAAFVQASNPDGVKSTPVGRYQFVGDTLRDVVREMNIPLNTLFTPEVQDAMFMHRMQWRLARYDTREGKRDGLKLEWQGFNKLSDDELDRIIDEMEGRPPASIEGLSVQRGTGPLTSQRPRARPMEGDILPATGVPNVEVRPVDEAPVERGAVSTSPRPQGRAEARAARQANEQLTQMALNALESVGVNPDDVPRYGTTDDLDDAIDAGEVKPGDFIIVNGRPMKYDG